MATHDRITKLLLNRTPSIEDTGSAIWRALSKKSTFGEELNAIRAGRIQDEATLYDLFTKERGYKLDVRKQGLAEKKLTYEKLQAEAKAGNDAADGMYKASNAYGATPAERAAVFAEIQRIVSSGEANDPDNLTDAYRLAATAATGLKASGKIKGVAVKPPKVETFFDKPTGREYKAKWNAETKQYERVGGLKAVSEPTITPRTDLGKIEADLQTGLITEDEAEEQNRIVKLTALAGLEEGSAKDEFNRNLQRVLQLERAGQTNTREYKLLSKRLEKQTEDAPGLSIEVDDQGNMSIRFGADPESQGLATALTARQALQQQAQLDVMDTSIERLNIVIGEIEKRPTTAGVIGAMRSFAQNIVGVVEDVLPAELANRVKETIALIPGLTDEEVSEFDPFFDPVLPETEIYQNTIAFELAKLRIQSGDKNIRALKVAFDIALKDVKLRGMFGSKTALTRLRTVRTEFETERAKLRARLRSRRDTGEVPDGVTPEQWRFMTPEDRELFR